jgi:hypothetical protein
MHAASTDATDRSRRILLQSLIAAGILMVVAGVIAGLWLGPEFFLIALVGLVDFALAWAFASGRLRLTRDDLPEPPSQPDAEPVALADEETDDPYYRPDDHALDEATDDPSYNPYARED